MRADHDLGCQFLNLKRVGCTGRAGNKGLACSLFHESEEYKIEILEKTLSQPIDRTFVDSVEKDFTPTQPNMTTLQIEGGKKQKIRPGDILGALTREDGIESNEVGKINISETSTFVAIKRHSLKKALEVLKKGKIKGKNFRARKI